MLQSANEACKQAVGGTCQAAGVPSAASGVL